MNKKYLCEAGFLSNLMLLTSHGNEFLVCLPTRLLASGRQGCVLLIFTASESGSQKEGAMDI